MKAYKTITLITIILFIAILSVASFVGVYVLKDYGVKNIIPKYKYGKEFSKSRVVELTVDNSTETEENKNNEEMLTQENFKTAKKIIKNRLKGFGVEQYTITQNTETGTITIDLTENEKTDEIISYLTTEGVFQITDSETGEVLLDNSNIKSINVMKGQNNNGIVIYLEIKFNKDGLNKLKEMSSKYIETVVTETNENGEEEEKTETKEFSVLMDGQELLTRHFEENDVLKNGTLDIPLGSGTNNETIQQHINYAKELKTIIKKGILPITYTQTNNVKDNSINIFENKIVVYSVLAICVIAAAILIIKFKLKGILASILQIGYVSLLLLLLRYVDVKITLTGIIAIGVSIIINYIYLYLAFKNIQARFIKETTKNVAIKLIPIYVIAIVFTFFKNLNISSIGTSLVWGIITMYLYNLTITQISIKTLNNT